MNLKSNFSLCFLLQFTHCSIHWIHFFIFSRLCCCPSLFSSSQSVQVQCCLLFCVGTKDGPNSKRDGDRNSIKIKLTFSYQCCKHTHTYTHTCGICPRRSSFKHLAMSQLASLAFYFSCLLPLGYGQESGTIYSWIRRSMLFEICIVKMQSRPPFTLLHLEHLLPPTFQILLRRQKDQSHERLTGQAHSTSL